MQGAYLTPLAAVNIHSAQKDDADGPVHPRFERHRGLPNPLNPCEKKKPRAESGVDTDQLAGMSSAPPEGGVFIRNRALGASETRYAWMA